MKQALRAAGATCLALALGQVLPACERPWPDTSRPCACLRPPDRAEQVLAKVGQVPISLARLQARRAALAGIQAAAPDLETLMAEEVDFELLAQAAYERGLSEDPEIIDIARHAMVKKLLQRDLGPQPMAPGPPPERRAWALHTRSRLVRQYIDQLRQRLRPQVFAERLQSLVRHHQRT